MVDGFKQNAANVKNANSATLRQIRELKFSNGPAAGKHA